MEVCKAHCLILPYPLQGHINPMFQFSKRLQHEGIKVTLVTTKSLLKTIQEASGSISAETISDGYDGGSQAAETIEEYMETLERVGSETLFELVLKLQEKGSSVDYIVYDALLPWAYDVAKKFAIPGAAFFTQSCAVNVIYYHFYKGLLKSPPVEDEVRLPGLPVLLSTSDLPSFISDHGSYPAIFKAVLDQFLNIEKADWLFFNTFYELEDKVIDWMTKIFQVRTIGPAVPSVFLDKRVQDDKEYGLNLFQPMTDACMDWLNERSEESVVYVSFGSFAAPNAVQMEEIAWGLRNSKKHFMWVVRKSEEDKLPKGFVEETAEKGLVVSWCPQLQVLAHKSMGCFLTHCGWNSTLEALSLGVPMVAIPQWTDQCTNAKFLVDFWKTGVKAQPDENGIVRRHIIEESIRQAMEGERGKELRMNATKWKELAKVAVDEGGSSDQNIKEFVSKLVVK